MFTAKIGELYMNGKFHKSEANKEMEKGVLEHLMARQFADSKLTDEGIAKKKEIIDYFAKNYNLPVTLKWNIHCGCSSCPCSPGFDIIAQLKTKPRFKVKERERFNIWVKENGNLDLREPKSKFIFEQILTYNK